MGTERASLSPDLPLARRRDLKNLHPTILINPTEMLANVVRCTFPRNVFFLSESGWDTLEDYQANLNQICPCSQSEGGLLIGGLFRADSQRRLSDSVRGLQIY